MLRLKTDFALDSLTEKGDSYDRYRPISPQLDIGEGGKRLIGQGLIATNRLVNGAYVSQHV